MIVLQCKLRLANSAYFSRRRYTKQLVNGDVNSVYMLQKTSRTLVLGFAFNCFGPNFSLENVLFSSYLFFGHQSILCCISTKKTITPMWFLYGSFTDHVTFVIEIYIHIHVFIIINNIHYEILTTSDPFPFQLEQKEFFLHF